MAEGWPTHVVLLAGEVAKLQTPLDARVAILGDSGREEVQPVVDELFRVLARSAKVNQLNLYHGLDQAPLAEARKTGRLTVRVRGFQRKFVQLGSVCITLNTKSSRRQSSMIRAAICVTLVSA